MPDEEGDALTTDADLLRKTAGGDRSAFEQLLERYESAVFRFVRAVTGNTATAEDVLQETFVAMWRNASSFAGDSSARAWILTIARNSANRQFRRRVEEPQDLDSIEALGEDAGFASVDAEFAQRVESRELLEIGFRTLTPEEREVLVLREVEGFTGEEVAAMLGISLAAAKSRLHRARLRFVAALRETAHA